MDVFIITDKDGRFLDVFENQELALKSVKFTYHKLGGVIVDNLVGGKIRCYNETTKDELIIQQFQVKNKVDHL